MEINLKRVLRIWRREDLKVPLQQRERQCPGRSALSLWVPFPLVPGHFCSYDLVFDQTEDGRRLKWLTICHEYSRKLAALEVGRRMKARDVIRILEAAIEAKGGPPGFNPQR